MATLRCSRSIHAFVKHKQNLSISQKITTNNFLFAEITIFKSIQQGISVFPEKNLISIPDNIWLNANTWVLLTHRHSISF